MSNINDGLVVYLKLNKVTNGEIFDSCDPQIKGRVNRTQLVSDDMFGSCLSFNGKEDNYVEMEIPIDKINSRGITISAWFCIGEEKESSIVRILDIVGTGTEPKSYWDNWIFGLRYSYIVSSKSSLESIYHLSHPKNKVAKINFEAKQEYEFKKNTWYHFTTVFNLNTEKVFLYLDGKQIGSNILKENTIDKLYITNKSPAKIFIGYAGKYEGDSHKDNNFKAYNGKVSNVRVYNRALSEKEIIQVIEADKKPLLIASPTPITTEPVKSSLYRKEHPIDFSLLDKDNNYVLYISDDPSEQHILNLELKNSSTQAIQFIQDKEKGDRASNNNHHFELIFPSGTLSDQTLKAIEEEKKTVLENSEEWDIAISEELTKKQRVSLYFLYKGDKNVFQSGETRRDKNVFQPGETRRITLSNMSAAAGSGARGTHVELKLNQLAYYTGNAQATTTPPLITGYRLQKLHIANHVGRKNIPLHVGFVGSNRILNDGSSNNTLKLRITNVSKEAISLKSGSFLLSFDLGSKEQEWTIAETKNFSPMIKAHYPNHGEVEIQKVARGQGESPEWKIEGPIEKLEPKKYIDITLSNIITTQPSGYTNLYIRYENIPGYWDGQFVCIIEKAPLLFYGNKVGIGTINPSEKLEINEGDLKITSNNQGILFAEGARIYKQSGSGLKIKPHNDSDGIEFTKADGTTNVMSLKNGNIGIGTINPSATLDVHGNFKIKGESPIEYRTYVANNRPTNIILRTPYKSPEWVALVVGFKSTETLSVCADTYKQNNSYFWQIECTRIPNGKINETNEYLQVNVLFVKSELTSIMGTMSANQSTKKPSDTHAIAELKRFG